MRKETENILLLSRAHVSCGAGLTYPDQLLWSPSCKTPMPGPKPTTLSLDLGCLGPAPDLGREHVRQVRADGLLHLTLDLRLRILLQHLDRLGLRGRAVQLRDLHLRTSAFLSSVLELYQV